MPGDQSRKHEVYVPALHGPGESLSGCTPETDREIVEKMAWQFWTRAQPKAVPRLLDYEIRIRRPGKRVARYRVKVGPPEIESITET